MQSADAVEAAQSGQVSEETVTVSAVLRQSMQCQTCAVRAKHKLNLSCVT
jgi:hypothetical protein